ncbi:putative RNA methyltransferase [Agromyces sp. GXQ0307]|uniref:putative RNA methyltransferase n=1 Tax=Agromyces sp. GXQ0307 TaxID=3377835 RepID=UPI003839F160
MSTDSTWLRCPNCSSALDAVDERVYGCASGHRFDRSKYGYLTLLPPKAPRTVGDDRDMLTARARLLERQVFAPIADVLNSFVSDDRATASAPRVADLGCGSGYYSARLVDSIPSARILVADRSPDAVRMALRAVPVATGVVLDIWRPIPVRDATADVILNVFAPRNPAEFRRILRPEGRLIVVVPTAAHLGELRVRGALLDIPPEKDAAVSDQLRSAGFARRAGRRVEYEVDADPELRAQLAGMGPSAHHSAALAVPDDDDVARVTVSVDVITFEVAHPS